MQEGFKTGYNLYLENNPTPTPRINFGTETLWEMFKTIWKGGIAGYNHPPIFYE